MAKLNPVFSGIRVEEGISEAATVKGVALKTFILLGVALVSAFFSITYGAMFILNPIIYLLVLVGALVGGIVGQFSPRAAKVCSILYSICEGAMLGLLSFLFEAAVGGVVLSAVLITFTIFGVMLFLYTSEIVKVNDRFMRIMYGLGLTFLIVSLVYLLSALIAPGNILIVALTQNTGLLVLVSLFIIGYGAFMLAMDFEQVKRIVANGFDKRYEWMAALGLMVTLVWIYVEVLRLLAILSNRD
jgi:uncharacterized YccA/Bax inhibitor family protein